MLIALSINAVIISVVASLLARVGMPRVMWVMFVTIAWLLQIGVAALRR